MLVSWLMMSNNSFERATKGRRHRPFVAAQIRREVALATFHLGGRES
jgi:hypothetical protein